MTAKARPLAVLLSLFLAVSFFPATGHCDGNDLLKHPREMSFPNLTFAVPKAEKAVLSNGLSVYLLEDSDLPVIRISALIRTGSMFDPPGMSGVADLTARTIRNGGTIFQTPRAINEALEAMGAQIEFHMDTEHGSAGLFSRTGDFPRVLSIFAELLTDPGFDPSQFDLAKKAAEESIRRQNDTPESIAAREFRRALYRGNPRGEVPTLESIGKIQRGDLIAFYRRYYQPNNMILGVSGDFKKSEMVESLEKAFRNWSRASLEIPSIPAPEPLPGRSVYYAAKDLTQSTIYLGQISVPFDHPDYYPLQVLNYIMGGGGFSSLLTREIRLNRGLAYSVGSYYQGHVGYGVLAAYCQTKSESTHEAISLIIGTMEDLKKNPPGEESLAWAKFSLINKFIFSFTSPEQTLQQHMWVEYDRRPEDLLEKYRDRIAAVTPEDIARVAREYLTPENSVLLVVGKEENFDRPLSTFGEVKKVELKKYR
ncbi:MAG TPA: pitrilysin family protein [Thermodesulfobacteriota bacterium]|nr:pitrilysin family protein [Thermodesulfobacteriota bacterium]